MELTQEQINSAFENAPDKIKEAIMSMQSFTTLKTISSKYLLSDDQASDLADETSLLLLGFTNPKDFISHLSSRLNLPAGKTGPMAQEINEFLFRPVRNELRQMYNLQDTDNSVVPEPKPLSKELEETVGLGRPREVVEKIRTYPRDIEKAMERKDELEKMNNEFGKRKEETEPASAVSWQKPPAPPTPTQMAPEPEVAIPVPKGPENRWVQPGRPLPPPPMAPAFRPQEAQTVPIPPPLPKTSTYPENFDDNSENGTSDEENLNREEILRGIEDPSTIKATPPVPRPMPQRPSGGYSVDPYREPTE